MVRFSLNVEKSANQDLFEGALGILTSADIFQPTRFSPKLGWQATVLTALGTLATEGL
jgi:hypothetical protein